MLVADSASPVTAFVEVWSGGELGFESLGGGLVGACVEVAVDVEDGLNRGVAEPVGDHFGVFALGDEEGYLGSAEGVGAQSGV